MRHGFKTNLMLLLMLPPNQRSGGPSCIAEGLDSGGQFSLTSRAGDEAWRTGRGTVRSQTELGARFADSYLNNDGALVLNGRLAWQYNLQTSAGAVASFVALPGSSFAVNGAGLDRNLALVSLGLTQENTSRFTYGAKIDAALGPLTQTVFGTMMVGYRF